MSSRPRFALTILLASLPATGSAASTGERPNVVVILADDFGIGDVHALDEHCAIPTPNLDRLVAEGRVFSDAHSPSAVCSPTRYGLLTGRYAWRTCLKEWVLASYEPPLIDADRPTLPGLLRDQGYATSCVGKWHLGFDWPGPQTAQRMETRHAQVNMTWDFAGAIPGGPVSRGFDHYFGTHVPNFPPFTFFADDRLLVAPTAAFDPDLCKGMILPASFRGAPMAPDWDFRAILPTLAEHAAAEVRRLAATKQPFFLYFSMTSPHEPLAPSPAFQGRSGIAPIADFLMETDWAAGEVLAALDEAGVAENTIVVFTADNGHSHYTGWEALTAAGHRPAGPYRGHKGDVWEGGHRVPLIVRWPGHAAASSRSDQLVSLTDLFATCAEVVGAPLPEHGAEDSESFLGALLGRESFTGRRTAVQHSVDGEFAYRSGAWKLVLRNAGRNLAESRGKDRTVELYDLASDPRESTDLAAREPERVQALLAELRKTVVQGASRPGASGENDAPVDPEVTQAARWATAER